MTKCALLVIGTVVVGDNTGAPLSTTSLPATVSSLRPQYSRARLVKEVVGSKAGDRAFLSSWGVGSGCGEGEFWNPWGVVCTPSGMVVFTALSHRLQMFTDDLEHIRSVGSKGTAAGQFMCPRGITTDDRGYIFIADNFNHRIQVVDEEGSHLCMFGSQGTSPGQYQFMNNITMDQNQRLYVCDDGNNRVQVVAADGRHLYMCNDKGEHRRTLLCGQPGGFSRAGGTVTDAWGTLLVTDMDAGCVRVLGEEGRVSCRIGTSKY